MNTWVLLHGLPILQRVGKHGEAQGHAGKELPAVIAQGDGEITHWAHFPFAGTAAAVGDDRTSPIRPH